eukprot:4464905-Alexandrium_andersonii.AAC.1
MHHLSSAAAAASPATPPVLASDPRQARRTPRARSGARRATTRCPGHASRVWRTSWRKSSANLPT